MTNRFDLLEIDTDQPAASFKTSGDPATDPGLGQKIDQAARQLAQKHQQMKGEAKHDGRLPGVDLDARARAIATDQALQAHGLAFKEPTFFAWGTKGQWGDAAARARAELHAMPLHAELAAVAGGIVKAEDRQAQTAPLCGTGYLTDDRLCYSGKEAFGLERMPMSPQAVKQLLGRASAPGGAYLTHSDLSGDLRAPHVNHWIARAREREEEARAAWRQAQPAFTDTPQEQERWAASEPQRQKIKLLSKLDSQGQRAAYGIVGPRFPHTYGMDRVIADVSGMFPGEARGSLFYDSSTTRWRVDAAVGAEFEPVVGDVYRLGVRYGAHDAGGGSYYADLYGIRVRCVNFTKIHGLKRLGRVRHIGTVETLQARIRELVGHGAEAMQAYAGAVREANESAICERALEGDGDARAVFSALIDGGYLPAPDGPEIAASRYFDAWLKEPGHNRIDFVNAATRAAHEGAWSSPWVTEEIEDAAGKLLYQRLVLTEKQIAVA